MAGFGCPPRICEKAAVLRYFGDVAAHINYTSPDPAVLSGIGTICADIEALTERVKSALDARTRHSTSRAEPANLRHRTRPGNVGVGELTMEVGHKATGQRPGAIAGALVTAFATGVRTVCEWRSRDVRRVP
jgi:hypothetical protein